MQQIICQHCNNAYFERDIQESNGFPVAAMPAVWTCASCGAVASDETGEELSRRWIHDGVYGGRQLN